MKDYVPVYELKKKNGEEWPGLINNKDSYGDSSYLKKNLPDDLILFDPYTLKNLISKAGFVIDECDYLGSRTELVPEPFKMDGREWVGLIATKDGGDGIVIMTNSENGEYAINYMIALIAQKYHWPCYFPYFDELITIPEQAC